MSPKTTDWGADWSRLPVRVLGDWVIPGLPGLPLADRIRICTRCERRSVTNRRRPAWRRDVCEVCAHVLALRDLPYDLCVEVITEAVQALPQRGGEGQRLAPYADPQCGGGGSAKPGTPREWDVPW